MVAAHLWRLLIPGGHLSMVAARSWGLLVHGGRWSKTAARLWRQLIHGSRLLMAGTCSQRWVVHRSCWFMEVACSWGCLLVEAASSWELLIHGGSLFMTATCQFWWPVYCSGTLFLVSNLLPVKIKIDFHTFQCCSYICKSGNQTIRQICQQSEQIAGFRCQYHVKLVSLATRPIR